MASPPTSLDRVVLLVACRRLEEAEQIAAERVAALAKAEPADRLALARAAKALADILLEAGKDAEAAPHVFEARRRYRPFRNDGALSAEVDLTLAAFAFADDRSMDGEQILTEATRRAEDTPGAELILSRLLRVQAHVQIARAEFEKGDERMGEAVKAARRAARSAAASSTAEPALVLSQHLFTQGEVAFMLDDAGRARGSTDAALDVVETELRGFPEYVQFARGRAAHAYRVFGDTARAEELEARAEGRHG